MLGLSQHRASQSWWAKVSQGMWKTSRAEEWKVSEILWDILKGNAARYLGGVCKTQTVGGKIATKCWVRVWRTRGRNTQWNYSLWFLINNVFFPVLLTTLSLPEQLSYSYFGSWSPKISDWSLALTESCHLPDFLRKGRFCSHTVKAHLCFPSSPLLNFTDDFSQRL